MTELPTNRKKMAGSSVIAALRRTRDTKRETLLQNLTTRLPDKAIQIPVPSYYVCNDETIHLLYQRHQRLLRTLIKKYSQMDRAHTVDDLKQEIRIAITEFIESWDPVRATNMQESSFLVWCVLKRFQSIFSGDDKLARIYSRLTKRHVATLPYPTFSKQKRRWPASQYETLIVSRMTPMSDRAIENEMALPGLPEEENDRDPDAYQYA